jgi:hypothetical protein
MCLPRHPAVAYLFLVRRIKNSDMNPYPAVKSWKIEVTPMGKGGPPFPTLKWTAPVSKLRCTNPNCKSGIFDFTPTYEALISSKKTDNGPDGTIVLCDGNEHISRKSFRKCQSYAKICIKVEYA